jgi:hypothetical protein
MGTFRYASCMVRHGMIDALFHLPFGILFTFHLQYTNLSSWYPLALIYLILTCCPNQKCKAGLPLYLWAHKQACLSWLGDRDNPGKANLICPQANLVGEQAWRSHL